MDDREALKRIAEKLRRSGASIPAPQVTGTIEGCIVTGLCIALALVENEIEILKQPAQRTWVWLTEQQRNAIEDACEMIIGKPAFDAIERQSMENNT